MEELQNIQDYIHVIRGHRVMLDRDIAHFYGVETKRLNEKVKRNPKRKEIINHRRMTVHFFA